MARRNNRKQTRRRGVIAALLAALGTLVLIVVVIIGIYVAVRPGPPSGPTPVPGPTTPGEEPGPQPEHCPDVQFYAVPGTWESKVGDDPYNPTANPNSLMLAISRPLQEQFAGQKVDVATVAYPAQFRNPQANGEMSYDDSRAAGLQELERLVLARNAECPQTSFVVAGFSQGAVIAGDFAWRVGNGQGVVPAARVAGVTVIADGRRRAGEGIAVGNGVPGQGAEISLQPFNGVTKSIAGATMTGVRPVGFGELNDRVNDICAPGDGICDAPVAIGDVIPSLTAMAQMSGVHAQYATNPEVIPGTTATEWTRQWAADLISANLS